jgi:hypothetical protein
MYKMIIYNNTQYRVDGCKRSGFIVHEIRSRFPIYLGRSIAETAHKAVIDVMRNLTTTYY